MDTKTTKRNAPKRVPSSESRYSLMEFDAEFPDDSECLEFLVRKLYPEGIFCPTCKRITRHHRVKARTCYECQFCGHQEYPMKGTIFEGSSISLRLWFRAMYLMASTRCGISAKQLERETGVSYPTAWRMFKQIRSLLPQDEDGPLSGTVEMDEAYIHRRTGQVEARSVQAGSSAAGRRQDCGVRDGAARIEREARQSVGGRGSEREQRRPDASRGGSSASRLDRVHGRVARYNDLGKMGYTHSRVQHAAKVYVSGDVHTQTIEGFWSLVKRGISGVYHRVSTKHLQAYLDEYVFRYNNREITGRRGMFDAFLSRIEKPSAEAVS